MGFNELRNRFAHQLLHRHSVAALPKNLSIQAVWTNNVCRVHSTGNGGRFSRSGWANRGARANCIGAVTYPYGVGPGPTWFSNDSNMFIQAAAGTFGTCGTGTLWGLGLSDWDAGITHSFSITESELLKFRGGFIDFTNTPVFNVPSSQYGQIRNSKGKRNIKFALKLYFWHPLVLRLLRDPESPQGTYPFSPLRSSRLSEHFLPQDYICKTFRAEHAGTARAFKICVRTSG